MSRQRSETVFELSDRLAFEVARQLHDLLLQLPDRNLALSVADLEVVDRNLARDSRDLLLLGGEQAGQPGGRALAYQDHARLADSAVHHVHVAVRGDRGSCAEAAAQVLQNGRSRAGLSFDRLVLGPGGGAAEENRAGQECAEDAKGQVRKQRANEQANQQDDHEDPASSQANEWHGARVLLMNDARDHADLLDPPHRGWVFRVRRLGAGAIHHACEDTGPDRCCIACRYSLPARYEDLTNGPDCTPAKPSSVASSASSSNSCGSTHRSIG